MKYRRVLIFAVLLVTGLSPGLAQTLSIYAFSEYLPGDLITGFESATGTKVSLETYASNEEMLAGLAANPTKYDLIIPSDYTVEILRKQNALLPLDLEQIPNYNNIQVDFLTPYFDPGGLSTKRPGRDNAKYTLPFQWGTTAIAYNKEKISTPIMSWNDLWKPEFAGHIVVLDDSREMLGMALLSLGYSKNETDIVKLAEAKDKLKHLAPSIIAYNSETPETYLISGEAWLGVMYNGNAALAQRQNPNIDYVFPKEGAGIWFDNMAIPKNAPNPKAAMQFMNYVLEPANSVIITRDFPYSNPNQKALAFLKSSDPSALESYQKSSITNPPKDVLDNAKLVKNVGDAASQLYEQYWKDVKATQ
jgi:spermidine/putrescine-binding protein